MDQEFKNLELFEAYESQTLDVAAQQEFEKRLTTDKNFKEEYELYQTLMGGIELEGDELLRNELSQVESKLKKEDFFALEEKQSKIIPMKKSSFSFGKMLSIAASLLLLLVAGMYFFSPNNVTPAEALAKFDHSAKEKAFLSEQLNELESLGMADLERGKKDTLAQVLKLYDAGEYQTAYNLATSYINAYPNDATAMYYAGMAKFQDVDYSTAAEWLSEAVKQKETAIFDRARWYLALTYTMLETTDGNLNATKLFNQIMNDTKSDYKTEATWHLDIIKNR